MLEKYWTIQPLGTSCRYDPVESMRIPVLEMCRGLPRTPISRGNVSEGTCTAIGQIWKNRLTD